MTWNVDVPDSSIVTNILGWGRGGVLYQWIDHLGRTARNSWATRTETGAGASPGKYRVAT
jgi:hypothetical protein